MIPTHTHRIWRSNFLIFFLQNKPQDSNIQQITISKPMFTFIHERNGIVQHVTQQVNQSTEKGKTQSSKTQVSSSPVIETRQSLFEKEMPR